MLILCIGPDTFRAQEKARELEAAFKQKFDLGGLSMERLATGKDAAKQILERANTASLFSPRRLMRTGDLVSECPKAFQTPLLQALTRDAENIIVISVENEQPAVSILKLFSQVPKFFKFEFPLQHGPAFNRWLTGKADNLGVKNQTQVSRLAEYCDGDSWLAWNELVKLAAGSAEDLKTTLTPTIFELAEKYLMGNDDQRAFLGDREAVQEALTVFLSQARAALRVRDRDMEGLHPFLIRKMQSLNTNKINLEQIFATLLMTLLAQRTGYGSEEEILAML